MYSLVLMTAMTGAPDGPEFNGYFRDLFRGGCSGGCSSDFAPRYSCYGGGCGGFAYTYGCSGSSSSAGCRGDGFGSRVRRLFDRGGCCGGCSGSGYGCSGSGYACFGSGSYSCFGGPAVSYTPVFNGGLSCQGGPAFPAPPPVFDAAPRPAPPATIPYAPPEAAPPAGSAGLRPAAHTATPVSGNGGARATVVVRVPADAKLFVDARQLALTGAERKFVSPELPAGQEFAYRFRAEYERDGETVSVTRRVAVRAGAAVAVEFTDLTAKAAPAKGADAPVTAVSNPAPAAPEPPAATPAAAEAGAERATITVKLPAGASLYVDDKKSPSAEPVRRFSTPPLPGGREFAYLMRAEVVRDGRTETFTQKVPFKAGERVEVDFTGVGR